MSIYGEMDTLVVERFSGRLVVVAEAPIGIASGTVNTTIATTATIATNSIVIWVDSSSSKSLIGTSCTRVGEL